MPRSSSATCTVTSGAEAISPKPVTECVTRTASSAASSSCWALAVTVWAVFQSVVVKIKVVVCGVESPSSCTAASVLVAVTVTSPAGAFTSTTL